MQPSLMAKETAPTRVKQVDFLAATLRQSGSGFRRINLVRWCSLNCCTIPNICPALTEPPRQLTPQTV
jgi:hypothetical protein